MNEFLANFLILLIVGLGVPGIKIYTLKKLGTILKKKYSLTYILAYWLASLIFLILIGGWLFLRFYVMKVHSIYDFNPIVPIVLLSFLFVYPWNIYLGERGFSRSLLSPLNAFYMEKIYKEMIEKVDVEMLEKKVLLRIDYKRFPSSPIRSFSLYFPLKDYSTLQTWQKMMQ